MTELLMLSRYARQGASSRLRMFQYQPFLEAAGFAVEQAPLLGEDYLTRSYAGQRALLPVLGAYARRALHLAGSGRAKLLWLEKEALPWVPWAAERMLLSRKAPIVSDYDDAIFHQYELHRSPIIRAALSQKIDRVMKASALVIAGNAYLAERAMQAGARRVEIVPTVVDLEAYAVRSGSFAGSKLRVGWIGTPSTWAQYMEPLMPWLLPYAMEHEADVLAIGAGLAAATRSGLEVRAWAEETEVAQIQQLDIGVMPLSDTPWSRGKCGYKLIQYMACGLPVVASPVGVNTEIVDHGVNGFLASSEQEWKEALVALLSDPDLRKRMGDAGRKKVEQTYSLQVHGPRLASLISEIAGHR